MTEPDAGLQLDPALRQEMLVRSGSPDGPAEGEASADELLSVVARLDPEQAEVPGLRTIARFGGIVTARVRLADVLSVRRHHAVRSLKLSRVYGPTLSVSVPDVRGTAADLRAIRPGGLSGRGVVIAVLDWGLDFVHANFRDDRGRTRVRALWDQRGGETATSPDPFGYGRVHETAAINAALAAADPYAALGYDPSDADPDGQGTHGTHVTDIAAGNARAPGSSQGLAPGAELLFVHLRGDDTRPEDTLGDSARLLEACAWAVARAAGDPLVIHMSLGRTGGPHDASPLVVRAFDQLLETTTGVAVVMSCGNYRDARMHASVRVPPGGRLDLAWHVPDPGPAGAELELWYSGTDRLGVSLVAPDGSVVAQLPLGGRAVVRDGERLVASGFHRRHDPNNAANQVDLFVLAGAPTGTWIVRLTGDEVRDGRVDAWIERTGGRYQSRFPAQLAAPHGSTGSICNGWLPLAVGAYDARAPGHPSMHFSSAGPTRDGRRKPDISAPGGGIVAARSSIRRADGSRALDGLTTKSGTSMAAPHVSGATALVFEAVAPQRLPMPVLRWVLLETARRAPPSSAEDDLVYGAGRLDVRAACTLARALVQQPDALPAVVGAAADHTHEGSNTMASFSPPDATAVLSWLAPGEDFPEAAVGQLVVGDTPVLVEPRAPFQPAADLDAALRLALARTTEHTVITADGSPPAYQVAAFGPATSLPGPPVASFDGPARVQALIVNGGERVYACSDPTAANLRWVDIPRLDAFYRLPAADATRLRNTWADVVPRVLPSLTRAQARALPIPVLRTTLAHSAAGAFPVSSIQRGTPPADAGGVVNGITLPILTRPLSEPDCYLPVIAEVEGKLESINAWDMAAGVSLGPIQFNVDRGALFRFLWRLWNDDRDLFDSALTTPLGWRMAWDGDHPDLVVGADTLHGRPSDAAANAAYLQTGRAGGTGRDGPYRRRVAAQFRDCVAWPHVQAIIADVSSWWLTPALEQIRAAGIGPLDPANPDADVFVLTAMLLSARVRFSACLARILTELQRWTTVADKLAHWEDAVRATHDPCPQLVPRLRAQRGHAQNVHAQARRLLAAALPTEAEDLAGDEGEALDATIAAPVPATPVAPPARVLTPVRSARAAAWNVARHDSVSGVPGADIAARVALYVDVAACASAAASAGVAAGTAPFDAGTVEAIHQFQAVQFAEASQVDGMGGASTLDTLGFVRRTGMNPMRVANAAAQRRLNRVDARVQRETGTEFSAASWWEGMVSPAWLGRTFTNGIHIVLARRLRLAEQALTAQRAYRNLSGAALGSAAGIVEVHHGHRPTAATASMHTFGLAVDIGYTGNPWIVGQHVDGGGSSDAGKVTQAANRNLRDAVNRAALLVDGEAIDFTSAYLSRLASGTTGDAFDDLKKRDQAFRRYLRAAGDSAAMRRLVDARQAVAGVLLSGESLDDATTRWSAQAAADLAALRLSSVKRRNAAGDEIDVDRSNFSGRDPLDGFLNLSRDLVIALRDNAGLAWGAIDFGSRESGDVMHFDCRRDGVGALLYGS